MTAHSMCTLCPHLQGAVFGVTAGAGALLEREREGERERGGERERERTRGGEIGRELVTHSLSPLHTH